ncbi:MAG: peptide-methionine (S)-S-oxide reductase MsrA [Planctomycetes bacterium]|nr:peptide-methionine (S)-S-oxide reductase MsrA [Planctomycetota bacterium]
MGVLGLALLLACTDQRVHAAPEDPQPRPGEQLATFAGGCFWCMEPPFEGRPGVRAVISGYTGGDQQNPTYEQVGRGTTGHTEAVQVIFDPAQISYAQLLQIFWRSFDPTDGGGQFADRGTQYRPGIFPHDAAQRAAAEASKKALANSGKFAEPIAVEITDFKAFWPAEDYHQDYYRTHESDYKRYRKGSGRVAFLQKLWGEEAAWGHPVIEGVPDAQAPTHSEAPAAPTSQPTSRPAGQ